MNNVIEVINARFRDLTRPGMEPACLYENGSWLEGPLWLHHDKALLFSDIPEDRVLRWSPGGCVAVFSTGGFQNGRTLDASGRIIACEHGGRRLIAIESDGAVASLATHHSGGRLNSPNDVIVHANGSIWFTDPDYGILSNHEGRQAPPEQAFCHVFRLTPDTAEPIAMVSTMHKPNGLAFSPDCRWLYVSESGRSHDAATPPEIRRFEVLANGSLYDAGVLATLDCGIPDGLAVDACGNVWSSAGDGVHCFAPDGTVLGKLRLGCVASNLCFGNSGHLFITTARRLYMIEVAVAGAQLPGASA